VPNFDLFFSFFWEQRSKAKNYQWIASALAFGTSGLNANAFALRKARVWNDSENQAHR